MGDSKGAPGAHFNFPLQSFLLYLLSKVGLPLPVSLFLQNRGGLVNAKKTVSYTLYGLLKLLAN